MPRVDGVDVARPERVARGAGRDQGVRASGTGRTSRRVRRRTALEPRETPREAAARVGTAQAFRLEHGHHRGGRVRERAELVAGQAEAEVLGDDDEPRDDVAGRGAEDEHGARVARRRLQQPLVVGGTADDAVQHHDVGGLDAGGVDGDVVQPPVGPALEAVVAQQRLGVALVGGRELEVDRAGGAALEQLDLDLPDPAADLEHGRAVEPVALDVADHPPRRAVEPALAVALRDAAGEARAEEPIATAWIAAAGHRRTLSHARRGGGSGDRLLEADLSRRRACSGTVRAAPVTRSAQGLWHAADRPPPRGRSPVPRPAGRGRAGSAGRGRDPLAGARVLLVRTQGGGRRRARRRERAGGRRVRAEFGLRCSRRVSGVDTVSEVEIARPRAEVAGYACDPDTAPEWYENIKAIEWRSPRPLAVGTRVAFVAAFLGRRLEYTYEVRELVPGERLVMSTAQGPVPMETTYAFTDTAAGTRMTLRNRGEPAGFGRVAGPVMAAA